MAHEAGLELVRFWRHTWPATRNNYLFRKAVESSQFATTAKAS